MENFRRARTSLNLSFRICAKSVRLTAMLYRSTHMYSQTYFVCLVLLHVIEKHRPSDYWKVVLLSSVPYPTFLPWVALTELVTVFSVKGYEISMLYSIKEGAVLGEYRSVNLTVRADRSVWSRKELEAKERDYFMTASSLSNASHKTTRKSSWQCLS